MVGLPRRQQQHKTGRKSRGSEKLLRLSGKIFICGWTNAQMHDTEVSPTYINMPLCVRLRFECHNSISKRNFIKAKIISKTSFYLGKRAYRLLPAPSAHRETGCSRNEHFAIIHYRTSVLSTTITLCAMYIIICVHRLQLYGRPKALCLSDYVP